MILSQPELPIPLVTRFPFPAWATRVSEAAPADDRSNGGGGKTDDPFDGIG